MMIGTKEAAQILGYKNQSSVFNLLGNADKVIIEEKGGRRRKVALWDRERVLAGRDRREEFFAKRKLDKDYYSGATRACTNCGQEFEQKRKENLCPSCRKGMKKADPYGVYQVEELALSRTCRYPGCKNHPRKSALYCDKHQGKNQWQFDELSSSLGSVYTI